MNFSGSIVPHQVRRYERANLDLYINKIIGDEPHLARVRDISVSGIYLYKLLEPDLKDRARIGLEFKLPDCDDVIWALGEVVREDTSVTNGVAVRFVRIAETDRETIREFVAARRHVDEAAA
ncbi:PilZ domain-containing protein [Myxococcota bacterium]